jgi:hypothetical protein
LGFRRAVLPRPRLGAVGGFCRCGEGEWGLGGSAVRRCQWRVMRAEPSAGQIRWLRVRAPPRENRRDLLRLTQGCKPVTTDGKRSPLARWRHCRTSVSTDRGTLIVSGHLTGSVPSDSESTYASFDDMIPYNSGHLQRRTHFTFRAVDSFRNRPRGPFASGRLQRHNAFF